MNPANAKSLDVLGLELKGTHLIDASAGTGKTYTIETLYIRLLVELDLAVDRILVVTFTEAATKELVQRIRQRLTRGLDDLIRGRSQDPLFAHVGRIDGSQAKARIQKALRSFDEAAIFTIHSFCQQMLRDNAFESGVPFDLELAADQASLYRDIAHDFFAAEVYDKPPLFARYLEEEAGLTVQGITGMATTIAAGRDLDIVPEAPTETDPIAPYREAYGAARSIWLSDRSDIIALLTKNKRLNGRVYSSRYVAGWSEALDAYFAAVEPTRVCATHKDGRDKIFRFAAGTIAEHTKDNAAPPRHRFFEACETLLEKRRQFDIQLIAIKHRLITYVVNQLDRRKAEQSVLWFDDLLIHLDKALHRPEGDALVRAIRARFQAVLVDEFQDTDRTQYRILSTVYGDGPAPFFLIGDPKQSIYAFRGADIFSYLKAAKQIGNNRHTLRVNWRSDPDLILGINTLFEGVEKPFVIDGVDFEPVSPNQDRRHFLRRGTERLTPLQVRFVRRDGHPMTKPWAEHAVPELIAEDICELLGSDTTMEYHDGETRRSRPIRPSDIAVLTRTNQQLANMQNALRERRVPSVRTGAGTVFAAAEAAELAELLHAVAEPGHSGKLRAALATSFFGLTGNQIFETRNEDPLWEMWTGLFRTWHALWNEQGFMRMFHAVLTFRQTEGAPTCQTHILSRPGGQRSLANLLHLGELLHEETARKKIGMTGLLSWFERERAEGFATVDVAELRIETDDSAVQLVTIFKSKGLEYPIVYCPYLYQPVIRSDKKSPVVFHDPPDHHAKLDIGSEAVAEHRRMADREKMAEHLRLTYVALTRAKCLCVTVWGQLYHGQKNTPSALAYLFHNQGGKADIEEMSSLLGELADDEMLGDLRTLESAANGAIKITPTDSEMDKSVLPDDRPTAPLSCRRLTRGFAAPRQISSFSALVTAAKPVPAEREDQDHDAVPQSVTEVATDGQQNRDRVTLADFDAGALPGSCMHEIYEELDFTRHDRTVLESLVQTKLTRFGFQNPTWQETVSNGIEESLYTALDSSVPGLCLSAISHGQRLNELEFTFPVATPSATPTKPLNAAQLAEVFSRHGDSTLLATYPSRIAKLGFKPLCGFLKGFIDLVFEHKGRYYLADYKTNHLGNHYPDYAAPQLREAMAHHHYFLQYHLYAVALDRYLSYRLEDYDYDRHFGAVYYLFVRGMSPQTGPTCGVFRDRPGKHLIAALSSLMKGENAK